MSQNKSQGIVTVVVSFYHAIHVHAERLVQMPSKKKEEVASVFVYNSKAEEVKKSFSSDWAENLVESNTG